MSRNDVLEFSFLYYLFSVIRCFLCRAIIYIRDIRAKCRKLTKTGSTSRSDSLCPFGSLKLCLMNDYSMSNYKQGALFTRSTAANESGCAFNGLTPPTAEILSDGNHELWTKPVSTMRIYLRVLRHCHLLLLHISRCHLPPLTLLRVVAAAAIERIGRSRAPLTWFR